jgi:MoxR-like ATPase
VGDVSTDAELAELQTLASTVRVDPKLTDYAVRLVAATRGHEGLRVGAGPRASLALIRLARAGALFDGRDFVTPDDVRAWALPVLAHRVVASPEWEMDGRGAAEVLEVVLAEVEAPRE